MKGIFITFEGIDGSGKTTQLNLLGEHLSGLNYPVLITREPGGTEVGDRIRHLLLSPETGELVPWAEALLYAAARAQHVARVIKPALAEGYIVLCDRFLDSSLAYQSYGRGLDFQVLQQVNQPAVAGISPDLTLLLDFGVEAGKERISLSGRGADRIEAEEQGFYHKVRSGYLSLAAGEPSRFRIIKADRQALDIQMDIRKAVEEVLHGFPGGNSRM